MMAPNALGAETLVEQQEHSAFQPYSPEHYSDVELDGGRWKGANGKPRTRLGYQRISIACCMHPQLTILMYSVLPQTKDPVFASHWRGRQMPELRSPTTGMCRPTHCWVNEKRWPQPGQCNVNGSYAIRRSTFDESSE